MQTLLIGNGRLAKHFQTYCDHLRIPLQNWHRQSSNDLSQSLKDIEVVLLAIRDDAIEEFCSNNATLLSGKTIFHFSGSVVTPLARSVHPLMAFAAQTYDPAIYKEIPFVTEDSETKNHPFWALFPNPFYVVRANDRALYHALCSLAGNLPAFIWQKVIEDFENKFIIPSSALSPYLKQNLVNVLSEPRAALTGPVARKDYETIKKQLNALAEHPLGRLYSQFVEAGL